MFKYNQVDIHLTPCLLDDVASIQTQHFDTLYGNIFDIPCNLLDYEEVPLDHCLWDAEAV